MQAIIGYTGFVGSTYLSQTEHDEFLLFNRSNAGIVEDPWVDHLLCAGIDARKWLANKEPVADLAAIEALFAWIGRIRTPRATLISTVDVYGDPRALTESDDPNPSHAYGANRLRAEALFSQVGDAQRILRLPALFGRGLRKNALKDLLSENGDDRPNVRKIHPGGSFQWYDMSRLSADVARSWLFDAPVSNMATAPITMREIVDTFFPDARDHVGADIPPSAVAPRYEINTSHGANFGGEAWIEPPQETRRRLADFIVDEQRRAGSFHADRDAIAAFITGPGT